MNPNMQKWIDALRSGEFSQTRGTLRNDEGYCCLGVACEISGVVEWHDEPNRSRYFDPANPNDWSDVTLPMVVRKWLGLELNAPDVYLADNEDGGIVATAANDDMEWDFEMIADALERKYLA